MVLAAMTIDTRIPPIAAQWHVLGGIGYGAPQLWAAWNWTISHWTAWHGMALGGSGY
jgi:hypothetical protein